MCLICRLVILKNTGYNTLSPLNYSNDIFFIPLVIENFEHQATSLLYTRKLPYLYCNWNVYASIANIAPTPPTSLRRVWWLTSDFGPPPYCLVGHFPQCSLWNTWIKMSDWSERKNGVGPKTPANVTRPYSMKWVGLTHLVTSSIMMSQNICDLLCENPHIP